MNCFYPYFLKYFRRAKGGRENTFVAVYSVTLSIQSVLIKDTRSDAKPQTVGNLQRYSQRKINLQIQRRERDIFRIIRYQVKMFKSLESGENDLPNVFGK